MMKSFSITVLALCIALSISIPYKQQISVLNSL
jgi:hypothetical protein